MYKGGMKHTAKAIADAVGARLMGDGSAAISGVASLASAGSTDLSFVEDQARLEEALESRAGAVLAGEFAAGARSGKVLLLVKNPRLAFARAAALICGTGRHVAGVHATAVVAASAKIGEHVAIEAHAVVGERASIGKGTSIGAGTCIGEGVVVGADCRVYPNVTIYPGTRLGERVTVHAGAVLGSDGFGFVPDPTTGHYEKFPQVGALVIGDDVEIGANTTIDRGALDATVIGPGTKLDNLVHVGHNVQIGKNVVVAAQTGFSGSSVAENSVIVGGQVGIADHVRIEEGAILGAQCGVPTKKVIRGKGVVFWGTPARPIREYLKELAVLARLAKKS
jgi:UDP-3-O-[3-hydroxymyristoyl] glucosamine N-acyltransferase